MRKRRRQRRPLPKESLQEQLQALQQQKDELLDIKTTLQGLLERHHHKVQTLTDKVASQKTKNEQLQQSLQLRLDSFEETWQRQLAVYAKLQKLKPLVNRRVETAAQHTSKEVLKTFDPQWEAAKQELTTQGQEELQSLHQTSKQTLEHQQQKMRALAKAMEQWEIELMERQQQQSKRQMIPHEDLSKLLYRHHTLSCLDSHTCSLASASHQTACSSTFPSPSSVVPAASYIVV